jgi:hypothetical protein
MERRVARLKAATLAGFACSVTASATHALIICDPYPYCYGGPPPVMSDSNAGAPSDGGATDDTDGSQGCDPTGCDDAPQQDTTANDQPQQVSDDAINDDIAQQDELIERLLRQDEELAQAAGGAARITAARGVRQAAA